MADLSFMMGKHPALLPERLRYCRNHMWCQTQGELHCFGFSSYAVRLMQDVYFLDWCMDEGAVLAAKQNVGNIETSKAVSDLFAPINGILMEINRDLLRDPSGINVDCYGIGWLFKMTGDITSTMDVRAYHDYLDAGWENTQRLFKGQMGD
jgi:glycine cleavage system H protein